MALQTPRDLFRRDFHVDEHHAAAGVRARQQTDQQRQFFFRRRKIHELPHAVCGHEFGFDGELLRLVHVLVREFEHAMAQSRGEQQTLPPIALRQTAHQETHILDETEVEHAIGFVDHHDFDGAERKHMLLEIIDETAGRGDDDVHTVTQLLTLLIVIDAAINQCGLQAGVAADIFEILVDLDRQLARRRDDECARIIRAALGKRGLRQQSIEHGDEKRCRLARAGLRLTGDIFAGKCERQR